MLTKRIGNTAEAWVIAKCVDKGWAVLLPFGDTEPYDLVLDRGQGFETVQVKAGRYRNGCIEFNAYSNVGRLKSKAVDYKGKVDLFAVYYDRSVYFVPVEEVGTTKVALRLLEPKHNMPTIKWANDYLVL